MSTLSRKKSAYAYLPLVLALIYCVSVITVGVLTLWPYRNHAIVTPGNIDRLEPVNTAIVFGAGLTKDGSRPSSMLHDRLAVAAELHRHGKVKEIIVSGDNRFADYSEPDVMKSTLVNDFDIPENDIHADYAGRRTYDTCARAHDLWGVRKAILVTQDYHLPRAIMTCEAIGISSQGASSSLRQYRLSERFVFREIMAILKAYVDIYVWHPKYLGGDVEARIDI
jgi:vancomycin permeability regulator SanA